MCTRFANKTNIKAQLRAVRNIWEFVVFCQANITSFKLASFDPVKISLAASNSSPNIKVRKALGKPCPAKIAFFSILKKGGGVVQLMFTKLLHVRKGLLALNRPKIGIKLILLRVGRVGSSFGVYLTTDVYLIFKKSVNCH